MVHDRFGHHFHPLCPMSQDHFRLHFHPALADEPRPLPPPLRSTLLEEAKARGVTPDVTPHLEAFVNRPSYLLNLLDHVGSSPSSTLTPLKTSNRLWTTRCLEILRIFHLFSRQKEEISKKNSKNIFVYLKPTDVRYLIKMRPPSIPIQPFISPSKPTNAIPNLQIPSQPNPSNPNPRPSRVFTEKERSEEGGPSASSRKKNS